jgi:predicted anti-sigma-YlaC factor YlaD
MTCHEIKSLFMDYLKDELPPGSKDRVTEHLQACPDCAGEFAAFAQSWKLLGEFKAPEPSPYFLPKLHEALNPKIRHGLWSVKGWAWALSLFLVILLGAMLWVKLPPKAYVAQSGNKSYLALDLYSHEGALPEQISDNMEDFSPLDLGQTQSPLFNETDDLVKGMLE